MLPDRGPLLASVLSVNHISPVQPRFRAASVMASKVSWGMSAPWKLLLMQFSARCRSLIQRRAISGCCIRGFPRRPWSQCQPSTPRRAVIRRAAAVFPTGNFLLPFFRRSDAPGRQRNAQATITAIEHFLMMFFMPVCLRAVAPATAARGPTGCGFRPAENLLDQIVTALAGLLNAAAVNRQPDGGNNPQKKASQRQFFADGHHAHAGHGADVANAKYSLIRSRVIPITGRLPVPPRWLSRAFRSPARHSKYLVAQSRIGFEHLLRDTCGFAVMTPAELINRVVLQRPDFHQNSSA